MSTGSHQLIMANLKGTFSLVEETEPLSPKDAYNQKIKVDRDLIYLNLNFAGIHWLHYYTFIHSTYSYWASMPVPLFSARGTEVNTINN